MKLLNKDKQRIINPNNIKVRDYKSLTTGRCILFLIQLFIFGISFSQNMEKELALSDYPTHYISRIKNNKDIVYRYYRIGDSLIISNIYRRYKDDYYICINKDSTYEIGKFKRRFNIFHPFKNICKDTIQLKRISKWEYHLKNCIYIEDYGGNPDYFNRGKKYFVIWKNGDSIFHQIKLWDPEYGTWW